MSLFKTSEEKDFVLVQITKNLTNSDVEDLKVEIKKLLLVPTDHFLIDFKYVLDLTPQLLAPFIMFSKDLKSNKKFVHSFNFSGTLLKSIKTSGLEAVFNPQENQDKAIIKARSFIQKKFKIDVEFLNPFITATIQTLKTQANTPLEAEKLFIKTPAHNPDIDLAGVINITSEAFRGTISLCFPKGVFLKIYENMLGEKHASITPEIQDGCGEILNIIFGNAKSELNAKNGYVIDKAIPTVLTGEKIKLNQTTSQPVVVLPFKLANDRFFIEITVEPT